MTDDHTTTSEPAAPPDQPPTVVVDGVSKWFGNKVAVADVTVSFGPGVTGLLGPNGAGKTTLLRMVVGLQHPSRGTIKVLGRTVHDDPSVQRDLALVPEAPNVHTHLTARQFVRLSANLHRLDQPDEATQRALETVELSDAADRPLGTFSKGMRQRAKVASALVLNPQVLILDEPLNGADPVQRAALIRLFTELGERGHTVIVSSHVLSEVDRMAERIVAMVDGRLAAVGSVRSLRAAITDRPRELVMEADRPHALAAALLGAGIARGVDVDGRRLAVRTDDALSLARALPRLARDSDARLHHVEVVDETLDAIFRDIAGGA